MIRFVPLLLLLGLALTSCLEEACEETVLYQSYLPIYAEPENWRDNTFTYSPPENICEPSGFYVYGDYLFIVDKGTGIHILDNSDNANPRPLTFLNVPGGHGIAARNNILYVNQYVDLLAFSLNDPEQPEFLSRTEEVFVQGSLGGYDYHTGRIVIGYEEGTETRTADCGSANSGREIFWQDDVAFFDVTSGNGSFTERLGATNGVPTPETVGVGGSLARFTIAKGNLYAVDDHSLRVFSLEAPGEPEFLQTIDIGWGIETIFPAGDELYIGAQTGMHIFALDDPLDPEFLSTFEHVRNCDPVVVQNDIAYVTTWGGSNCGSQGDQLYIIDVSNPRQPRQLEEIPMRRSHGLGVDGELLFITAGELGVMTFRLEEEGRHLGPQIGHLEDFNAQDVIVLPHKRELIVFGWHQAGIQQYDYDAEGGLITQSHLAVCP